MNKEVVLAEIKKGMSNVIEGIQLINLADLSQKEEELQKYFTFLKQLSLFVTPEELEPEPVQSNIPEPQEELLEYTQKRAEIFPEKAARFIRKLKGGTLEGTKIHVPEAQVRSLEIEHGDLIGYELIKGSQNRYHFTLKEKGDRIAPKHRFEFNYCVVKYDELKERYYVDQSLLNGGEDIQIHGIPQRVSLRREDVFEYNIIQGDIIDVAFSTTARSSNASRITWKHETIEDTYIKPKPSSHYKNKETSEQEGNGDSWENLDIDFTGKKVLVVGCEPRKSLFKYAIEHFGGEFIWAEGRENKDLLEQLVKKADVSVFLIRFIRHTGSQSVVELAKKHGKPFSKIETLGMKALVTRIANALNTLEETNEELISAE